MGKQKKFIQSAIKRPGSLRAAAKRRGLIKGDEKLSEADLRKLEKSPGLKKKVNLARTLKKLRKKK